MLGIMLLVIIGFTARQTDWMGGPGVQGPVNDWGTQYYMSDSVTVATQGQVSLIATQWDYSSSGWAKHIVESNLRIQLHTQGFMPADVDGDGIRDLVAHSADEIVWYKHDGNYHFSKNVIGPAKEGGPGTPCVYPCDLDKDNDIDVLVATAFVGVGWYENQDSTWSYHNLDDSTGYHRISAVDVELDGDMDIIAVNNDSSGYLGDIYLFRNNGSQIFTRTLAVDLPSDEGWRVYPQDFNDDGYADLYSVFYNTYIYLNDSTGNFSQSWYADFGAGKDFDGAWPSDIDMDGDIDLVCGEIWNSDYGFSGLLNDGTGSNFTRQLFGGTTGHGLTYIDGAMARDIDLDGYPDIAGDYINVGWFRQNPENPLTFTLYDIDTLTTSSHWIYADKLCEKCLPAIDLLVTELGAHIVYENQMLQTLADFGYLESSILKLSTDSCDPLYLKYFGYDACVPNDTSLCFYWRAGSDSADIVSKPWNNGPHYALVGLPHIVDSFSLWSTSAKMFQYKAEFRGAPNDIAVLQEVWIKYECSGLGVEENAKCKVQSAKLFQNSPNPFTQKTVIRYSLNENRGIKDIRLTICDLSGRLIRTLPINNSRLTINEIVWDRRDKSGKKVPAGIYFYRLTTSDFTATKKLTILR